MKNNEFYENFKESLDLDNKKYVYKHLTDENLMLSSYRELNSDFVYIFYNNTVYEISLNISYHWLSPVHTLRNVLNLCINDQADKYASKSDNEPVLIKFVKIERLKNPLVLINFKQFAFKVSSGSNVESLLEEANIKTPLVFFNKNEYTDLFINLKDYINKKTINEKEGKLNVFKDKCENGKDIDSQIEKIKMGNELDKKVFVDLVSSMILVLKEKNWINFKDIE
jgi:hypothetical protein